MDLTKLSLAELSHGLFFKAVWTLLEGYLEGYQRTAPPRPEGKLIPIAYRIAPRGRLK